MAGRSYNTSSGAGTSSNSSSSKLGQEDGTVEETSIDVYSSTPNYVILNILFHRRASRLSDTVLG